MTRTLLWGIIFLLTGCATSYQSGKFALTGGYIDQPVNDQLMKVTFYANGFTDIETARKYAMFRCGELANQKHKPYFLVYQSLTEASLGRPSTRANVGSVGGKPAAFAYLLPLDTEQRGAVKTSKVIADLETYRSQYQEAAAARRAAGSSKKKKK